MGQRYYHAAEAAEVYGRLWERLSGNLVVECEAREASYSRGGKSAPRCEHCGEPVREYEYRVTVRGARLEPGLLARMGWEAFASEAQSRGWGRAVRVTTVGRRFTSVEFEQAVDPAAVGWCEIALALRQFEAAIPEPGSPLVRAEV